MRNWTLMLAVSSLAVLGLAGGVAVAGGKVATTIHEDGENELGGGNWSFDGHLTSSKNKCLPDRKIRMYKRANGEWKLADKTKSNQNGEWTTTAHLPNEPALKFQVVKETVDGTVCGGDSIKPFSGPPHKS